METFLYRAAVIATMLAHFSFIAFVVFGALLAWKRRWLKPIHWAALAYGLWIEIGNWVCPLTTLENHLRRRGGLSVSEKTFIERHLEAIIYLDVPQSWLIAGAAVVVATNAFFYVWMARRQAAPAR